MDKKARRDLAIRLIEETRRIGATIKDIVPENGHLSLTWFPDDHVDAVICTVGDSTGYILDAWQCEPGGRLYMSHE